MYGEGISKQERLDLAVGLKLSKSRFLVQLW
jgi:hypothetical protein